MTERPTRLQGTDGIRSHISTELPSGNNALEHYLNTGLLTPAFFELYAFAFAELLKKEGLAQEGDWITIGWDTRDESGRFNEAAIQGLQKAGLNIRKLGVAPTPLVTLYMLHKGDRGSMVLTASHNPADQNGIKLFLGETGMKLLPPDDEALTGLIYELASRDLNGLSPKGQIREEDAWPFFVKLHQLPENSWNLRGHQLKQSLLLDCSKGALSPGAEALAEGLSERIQVLNQEGTINQHCGVSEIEGHEVITKKDVISPSAPFAEFPMLHACLEEEDSIGLVFDGDGDRCFRLDQEQGKLIVSGGDRLGILLAMDLAKRGEGGLFIHTVESDIMISAKAKELGFETRITGVGDKWILTQACRDLLQAQIKPSSASAMEFAQLLEKETSALALTKLRVAAKKRGELDFNRKGRFKIGLEESGHSITTTYLDGPEGRRIIGFVGNGFKAGLNSLFAAHRLGRAALLTPYPEGLKRTHYVYHVDKSRLEPGHELREELEQWLLDEAEELIEDKSYGMLRSFGEESSMVFCEIFKDNELMGAAFVRNSGTEDKTSIYLRGDKIQTRLLEGLGKRLHLFLLQRMKDENNPKVIAEREALARIARNEKPDLSKEALAIMERKEGLIKRSLFNFTLTEKGKELL